MSVAPLTVPLTATEPVAFANEEQGCGRQNARGGRNLKDRGDVEMEERGERTPPPLPQPHSYHAYSEIDLGEKADTGC